MKNSIAEHRSILSLVDLNPSDPNLTTEVLARRRAQRRMSLMVQAFCYCLDAVLLTPFVFAGTTSPHTPILFLSAGLSTTLVFTILSEIGFNDQFDEHYLAGPQSLISLTIMMLGAWLAPEVGFVFCFLTFVIFAFATLRCNPRDVGLLWTYGAVGLTAICLLTDTHLSLPTDNRIEGLASLLIIISALGRCVFSSLFTVSLRDAFYSRNQQLKTAYKRIEELAQTDELTGVLNRRFVMQALDHELSRTRRSAYPCSVALIDLDWFKAINDVHGHPAGDEVLRTFAIAVFANLRDIDRFGRYGGEEFLLIMPETPLDRAVATVDRLRQLVADLDWSAISPSLHPTISAGIATLRENDSADSLLARADKALYHAKETGRNRVCVH